MCLCVHGNVHNQALVPLAWNAPVRHTCRVLSLSCTQPRQVTMCILASRQDNAAVGPSDPFLPSLNQIKSRCPMEFTVLFIRLFNMLLA